MQLGVTIFLTDQSIGAAEVARETEARGFESLFVPEHTHIPVSRKTPYPGGEPLPEEYRRTHDPFVVLAAAAAATTTLRVGTGIALVAQRDPIVTAKAVASLDHLSGGRAALGIGFGWNEDEMADHGVDYRTRRDKGREHLLAMRRLWEDDVAEFHGEHVELPPSWSWPKPTQRPLPVLLGGAAGPKLFAHIAECGDGWIPIGGRGLTEHLPKLRAQVEEAGRDPDALEVAPMAVVPKEGKLDHYESIGVTEVVFDLESMPADDCLPVLDRFAAMLDGRARIAA